MPAWGPRGTTPRLTVLRARQALLLLLLLLLLPHLWATCDSAPCSEAVGTPQGAAGYVVTLSTGGQPVILPSASKRWRPPKR